LFVSVTLLSDKWERWRREYEINLPPQIFVLWMPKNALGFANDRLTQFSPERFIETALPLS
jgi:hypothetical protein